MRQDIRFSMTRMKVKTIEMIQFDNRQNRLDLRQFRVPFVVNPFSHWDLFQISDPALRIAADA
jgi:hypothetical protein